MFGGAAKLVGACCSAALGLFGPFVTLVPLTVCWMVTGVEGVGVGAVFSASPAAGVLATATEFFLVRRWREKSVIVFDGWLMGI